MAATQAQPRDPRIQGVRRIPLNKLKQHPGNPRRIAPERLEQLKTMLEHDPAMLQARPLIALPDGTVIAGNQRLAAALELGWKTIPVVYADLDDDTATQWMLRDNNPMGEWDDARVAELLAGVDSVAQALAGFDSRELDRILGAAAPREVDPDDVPAAPKTPRSRFGGVYELGPHRLMCGDATDADQVAELLGGGWPELCVTDPPYGVDYDPAWRQRAAEEGHLAYADRRIGEVKNDDRVDWREAWSLVPSRVIYCWHAGRHASVVQQSLEAAGFEIRCQIIWAKTNYPISRGHYHWRHEPCWYAYREGRSAGWIGDRKQTTVWSDITLDANVEGGHSTQKPVECMRRPIANHEGSVYDPFAGTGTTLIAAEMEGRQSFMMELDPGYCDVIRDRYDAYIAA